MGNSKIYMAVTADEYELPVFVTTNLCMLAAAYGMTANNLQSYITKGNVRRTDNVKFIRIVTEEREEHEQGNCNM